jgi:UDP-3-O-[3-hydroxymyristoyl] glucosamine N-acyltransferase
VGGELNGPPGLRVMSIKSLDDAGPDDLTFIAARRYARKWGGCKAGAALINAGIKVDGHDASRRALIAVPDAELALIAVLHAFAPERTMPDVGVHPTAWVHESAKLGKGVRIGAHVSVGRECEIGENVILHAGVRIYSFVTIGAGTEIHGNTVVRERCTIGKRVLMQQNVSVGADGFGYRPTQDGMGLIKIPHIGTVEIGDDVEIGSSSCIDRGKFGATSIGAGTKIDNLVQIAHNCRIGRCCILAGHCGLSGSVTLGDGVLIGGGAGVKEQTVIGSGAKVAAMAGIMRDIPAGETHLGLPAEEASQALRVIAAMRKMAGLTGNESTGRPRVDPNAPD